MFMQLDKMPRRPGVLGESSPTKPAFVGVKEPPRIPLACGISML